MEVSRAETWDAVRAAHRWDIPADYALAWDICDKWAAVEPDRVALIHVTDLRGQDVAYRFRDLARQSNRLANVFAAAGVAPGDRVAVLLPQVPETVLTHIAGYKLGAIILPLFTLFGVDGLEYRLAHSGAKAVVTDRANLPKIAAIRERLPELTHVWCIEGPDDGAASLPAAIEAASDQFHRIATTPETPAIVCYTSGTTGPPKGALLAQRVLPGHVPATQLVQDFFPQPGDRIWTPSDWAWLGGLGNIMLPALRFGVPLVARRAARFDADEAFDLIQSRQITNAFLAPTALKLMRQATAPQHCPLRAVGSGGESLGAAMIDWGQANLGLTINEFYGQTESNPTICSNAGILPVRPGAMGKPVPGKLTVVLDAEGQILPPGETGELAFRKDDPSMFLGYWQAPEKTAEKFVTASDGQIYFRSGDEGHVDEDGYFWFAARTDDVITTSGYRVGPSEIEDCLNRHPSVAMSAVIGVPDPVRTEVIKAFVKLADGVNGSPDLIDGLKAHVRARLSPHVTPRDIDWIDALPMTATGKIKRRDLRDR